MQKMSKNSKNMISSDIPIYKNGNNLSLIELRKMYGMRVPAFAKMANINPHQIREGEVPLAVRNKVKNLEKIINLLWKVTKGDEKAIKEWLHRPADEYFSLSPIEFMELKTDNAKAVFHNLQEAVYGEAMGA